MRSLPAKWRIVFTPPGSGLFDFRHGENTAAFAAFHRFQNDICLYGYAFHASPSGIRSNSKFKSGLDGLRCFRIIAFLDFPFFRGLPFRLTANSVDYTPAAGDSNFHLYGPLPPSGIDIVIRRNFVRSVPIPFEAESPSHFMKLHGIVRT
jgi:hypothetical protein